MQKIDAGQKLEELKEAYAQVVRIREIAKKNCNDIATRREEIYKLYLEADRAIYGALSVERELSAYARKIQEDYEELSEKLYPGEL